MYSYSLYTTVFAAASMLTTKGKSQSSRGQSSITTRGCSDPVSTRRTMKGVISSAKPANEGEFVVNHSVCSI